MIKKYFYLILNLLLIIPGIVVVYSYAYNYVDKEVILLEKKATALKQMEGIYNIITNMQKIRGLSNIDDTNIEIFDTIEELETANHNTVKKIHRPSVDAILNQHPAGTIADFDSYTSTIEALLLVYKLTAYNAQLTLNSNIKEYLLAKSVTNRLPYIVEYFARIRGLASSVHQHKLDKSVKTKIKNQLYMIEELLKNTKEMEYFNHTDYVKELLSSQKEEIAYIKKELLNKEYISLNGLQIFKNITKNIDYLNTLYYQDMNSLMTLYNKTLEKKNFIKSFIIFICILSIIIIILINLFYFSKIQKYIQQVEHLTIIDPMTKLYNRRFLENFIAQFAKQAERQDEYFTILMIDIDFFKKVNDTYGHDVGDKVIVAIARVLQNSIRKSDLAVRYGGEEFMVLLHYANSEAAVKVAAKIKNAFAEITFEADNHGSFQKTLSIGISEFPKDADTIWQCIKLADTALYVAKTTGRNKIVTYSKEMSENGDLR
jgi:diguanylate cyclase (GGDEF)-like protein